MSSVKSILNLIKFKMPKKYDRMIHLSVIVLILLGTLMIISTSVGETYESKLVVIKTIVKQFGFITVAYFCMINVASYFSLERIFKYIKAIGIKVNFCIIFVKKLVVTVVTVFNNLEIQF